MHYLKKIAGQTAIYGLSSVVPRLLNYILVPLHTRVFLQEDYGIITEVYAYLAVLIVLLTYGFETGFFRFATKEEDSNSTYSTAFYALLVSGILFISVFSLYSNSIVNFLGYSGNPQFIYIPAIIIGIDAFCTIPFAKLRLQNRAYTFAALKIANVTINVFFNFFFFLICPKYQVFQEIGIYNPDLGVTYVLISNLISTVLTTFALITVKGFLPKVFSFQKLKMLFIYSLPLLVSGFGGTTNEFLDRIFLKHIITEENNPLYQLGVYGANLKLAVLMVIFIQMYRYAAEPFIFSNADNKDSPQMYAELTKFFLIFTLFIFMGVGLFTEIFQFLIGKGFREGIGVVPILLLANLFFGLYFNFSIWYKLTNKTWYGIYYTFSGAAITITFYLLLIPVIGYYGAAVAKLICYIVITIICYIGGQRNYKIPYDTKRFLLYIVTSIILFLIGYFVKIDFYPFSFFFRLFIIFSFLILVLKTEKICVYNLFK